MLIPSAGDAYPEWDLEAFRGVVDRAKDGLIAVVQFHGVPDVAHPWVHTPPERFERYCLPLYAELAEMMGQRPVFVHADGDLEPLWDAIGRSGIRGLDSLTPPPDGDTSVADAVRLWPEMRLGVNFPSSLHLAPEADVYEAACEILSQGGHTGRLQIQVSENVPPDRWRHTYAAIIRAIRENPHA